MHYEFPSVQSSCSYACVWRHTAALQGIERTKRRLAQSENYVAWTTMAKDVKGLSRTVCAVSPLVKEMEGSSRISN
jgi:hypothetical protein